MLTLACSYSVYNKLQHNKSWIQPETHRAPLKQQSSRCLQVTVVLSKVHWASGQTCELDTDPPQDRHVTWTLTLHRTDLWTGHWPSTGQTCELDTDPPQDRLVTWTLTLHRTDLWAGHWPSTGQTRDLDTDPPQDRLVSWTLTPHRTDLWAGNWPSTGQTCDLDTDPPQDRLVSWTLTPHRTDLWAGNWPSSVQTCDLLSLNVLWDVLKEVTCSQHIYPKWSCTPLCPV